MKKIIALVLALVMVFAFAACGEKADEAAKPDTEKSEGVLTYAQYLEAANDTEVTIEAYVQAKVFSEAYGNISLFLQDADGAYYVYRMPAAAEDDAKLEIGAKVKVTGMKTEWAGEVELAEGSAKYELEEGKWVAEVTDVTAKLGTDDLIKNQNMKVCFKGLTVEASNEEGAAFLYNWDGSGAAGSNSDLYFNVSVNGNTYQFCVESDECAEGTDVYTAVTNLKVGEVIDCEGFLYWYNGANPHITAITVHAQ